MEKCRYCKLEFNLSYLMVHTKYKTSKNGLSIYYQCRKCNTDRCKKYRKTESGKKAISNLRDRQNKKFKGKLLARNTLNYAVTKGEILKPKKCEKCFKELKLDAHHKDYAKPLDVQWLCRLCHTQLHRPK